MASDSTGGLHYSHDVTEEIRDTDFTFTNPHNRRAGPHWVRGERVFAMPQGVIHIDPEKQKWAKEFVLIYGMDGPDGNLERVPDQWGIYDTNRRRRLQSRQAIPLCHRPARLRAQHHPLGR